MPVNPCLTYIVISALCGCYFGADIQGKYSVHLLQNDQDGGASLANHELAGNSNASELDIEPESIPIWGECLRKSGDYYVLVVRTDSHQVCYRCVRILARSQNILQLSLKNLNSCFTTEKHAVKACTELESDFAAKTSKSNLDELILVRNQRSVIPNYCPFDGRFNFVNASQPKQPLTLSNCNGGHKLDLVSVSGDPATLNCLGHWRPLIGSKYQTGLVKRQSDSGREIQTLCAVFYEEKSVFFVAFTTNIIFCSTKFSRQKLNQLEFVRLERSPKSPLPAIVRKSECRFPAALETSWERTFHVGAKRILHKSLDTFQTLESNCVQTSIKHDDRYLIHTTDQCGKDEYNCIWIRQRSPNVIEFQYGRRPSTVPSFDLCDNVHFLAKTWTTVGRTDSQYFPACPVAGEYTGILPDNPELCAKLSSDCNRLDVMYYTVAPCQKLDQYIEERKYQCLGQWEESDQLLAYVMRLDVPDFSDGKFECFVGKTDDDGRIFLAESGPNCRRNLRVVESGMELYKQRNCFGLPVFNKSSTMKPWFVPTTKRPPSGGIAVITFDDIHKLQNSPMKGENTTKTSHGVASIKTFSTALIFLCLVSTFSFTIVPISL